MWGSEAQSAPWGPSVWWRIMKRHTLGFCYGSFKGLSVQPRAAGQHLYSCCCSYPVTSGRLIPHMSVSTVSLVTGQIWGHFYLWSFTHADCITPQGTSGGENAELTNNLQLIEALSRQRSGVEKVLNFLCILYANLYYTSLVNIGTKHS